MSTPPLPTDPEYLARAMGVWPSWGLPLLDVLIAQEGRTRALRLWELAVDYRLARDAEDTAEQTNTIPGETR